MIKELFIKPQNSYKEQDASNKRAMQVRKVVQGHEMTKTADMVSEAINAKGNVDPKVVKIMIKKARHRPVPPVQNPHELAMT